MNLLLVIFLMIVVTSVVQNANVGKIKPDKAQEDMRVSLINDFVEELQVTYHIAFISTPLDLGIIHHVTVANNNIFTNSILDYDHFSRTMVKKLQQLHLQGNIPTLYVILHPK